MAPAGAKNLVLTVALGGGLSGDHNEMLVLVGVDVRHASEPAGREVPFGGEQLAVGVSRGRQEGEPLPVAGFSIVSPACAMHFSDRLR